MSEADAHVPIHVLADADGHTMSAASLRKYLEMKIHDHLMAACQHVGDKSPLRIMVCGRFVDRSHVQSRSELLSSSPEEGQAGIAPSISCNKCEKDRKRCNYLRPTLRKSERGSRFDLILEVWPGHDYVYHYACIVANWVKLFAPNPCKSTPDDAGRVKTGQPPETGTETTEVAHVEYTLPSEEACRGALDSAGLFADGELDVRDKLVILGIVDRLRDLGLGDHLETVFDEFPPWKPRGPYFSYTEGVVHGKLVVLLCAHFSIWSDIGGRLVTLLGEHGCTEVIYVGKVGGVNPALRPNATLVTGCTSIVRCRNSTPGGSISEQGGRELQQELGGPEAASSPPWMAGDKPKKLDWGRLLPIPSVGSGGSSSSGEKQSEQEKPQVVENASSGEKEGPENRVVNAIYKAI